MDDGDSSTTALTAKGVCTSEPENHQLCAMNILPQFLEMAGRTELCVPGIKST